MYGYDYYGYESFSNPWETVSTIFVLALFTALVLTVLTVILVTPEKRRNALNGFFRAVADIFNCKALLLEKILKFFYIFFTFTSIVTGVITLLYSPFADFLNGQIALTGLFLIILMPIIIRIIHEAMMLTIISVKNIISINNKLKSQTGDESKSPFDVEMPKMPKRTYYAPTYAPGQPGMPQQPMAPQQTAATQPTAVPAQEAAPNYRFCTSCGTKYDANKGKCPHGCLD